MSTAAFTVPSHGAGFCTVCARPIVLGARVSSHEEGLKHEPTCPGVLIIPPFCTADERCILDDGHDGGHVHELGEVLR
jgi:hypothetical protein